jgi:dUTP pyrophosphatase
MKLKVKKLHSQAKAPTYANPGDAGMDLYATEAHVIAAGQKVLVATGIAMELPQGTVGLIWDKSGIANKNGIKTLGGVVDASYRGEVKVGLINLSDKDFMIEAGDKVAQMLIQEVHSLEIEEAEELSDTERGSGGFGSTGK